MPVIIGLCLGGILWLVLTVLQIPPVINWKFMFGIFAVLNILDHHSTLLFIKKHGLEMEGNPFIKFMWKKWGKKSFTLIKLLLFPIILVFPLFYLDQDNFPLLAAINFFYVIVVANNYALAKLTNKESF